MTVSTDGKLTIDEKGRICYEAGHDYLTPAEKEALEEAQREHDILEAEEIEAYNAYREAGSLGCTYKDYMNYLSE